MLFKFTLSTGAPPRRAPIAPNAHNSIKVIINITVTLISKSFIKAHAIVTRNYVDKYKF